MTNKKISILGSTGSVGTQCADVAQKSGAEVVYLAAGSNIKVLEEQIRLFKPLYCAAADTAAAEKLKIAVADTGTKVYSGYDSICQLASEVECDIVFNSISGKNGLLPTLSVLNSGKTLALANKESMVCAGELVNRAASTHGAAILPVDSEHCAIFQCLHNGASSEVKKIILTASGGPFFGKTREQLKAVKPADALKHPTWNMGRKITVDSATLANKGLEIIEAMHLFGVPQEMIQVVIHRESIIHSMVEYKDNAVIAQLAVPDMRYPAQYALDYPKRLDGVCKPLDFTKAMNLTFYPPDCEAFPMLSLARRCADIGGVVPCVFNAANEVAVDMFLKEKIGFCDIYDVVEQTVDVFEDVNLHLPSLPDILQADEEARKTAAEFCKG